MRQFSAMAASTAYSTTFLLSTGNAPGKPRQTGQTLVLGGAPNCVEQPQKIFVCVSSCTCTSRPMTGSYFSRTRTASSLLLAISKDYSDADGVPRAPCPAIQGVFDAAGVSGISKKNNSLPSASRTPLTYNVAPSSGSTMPATSKNTNPAAFLPGSTARSFNCA